MEYVQRTGCCVSAWDPFLSLQHPTDAGLNSRSLRNLPIQAPMEAAAAISEQLVARVKASLERRVAKEAEFEGEGAWDEEDNDLLEEQIAPEEVCA